MMPWLRPLAWRPSGHGWRLPAAPRSAHTRCVGFGVGLAILTHLYALVWPLVFAVHSILLGRSGSLPRAKVGLRIMLATAALIVLPWLLIITQNWDLFVGQISKHESKIGFLSLNFYSTNLLAEIQRYHLGLRNPASLLRIGLWTFVAVVPISLGALSRQLRIKMQPKIMLLAIAAVGIPLSFGLFLAEKRPYYLISIMPLFSAALAWWLFNHWSQTQPWLRRIMLAAGVVALLQAGSASLGVQFTRPDRPTVAEYFETLRAMVPPGARVVAPQTYWIGLQDVEFRAVLLPGFLAETRPEQYPTSVAALQSLAPEILILQADSLSWFEAHPQAFQTFLKDHHAVLEAELIDFDGNQVMVYAFEWPEGSE